MSYSKNCFKVAILICVIGVDGGCDSISGEVVVVVSVVVVVVVVGGGVVVGYWWVA